jgi:putative protease
MLELLSPAGSPEAVTAAVQSGADAIYLGCGEFNARRNAKNFSLDELREAIRYCHIRGVRVFLTMNTLLRDRELAGAAELARAASDAGLDAILVQDLGVLKMLQRVVPEVELHASTQMTVHSLEGIMRCADLGMTRAVLSRELSMDAIAHICAHSPIEIEVFVHGALCMCYSGQCFFSSVIGSRSGNRGLCAQPCRLKYSWNGKANANPLSLKDMSLANHLHELRDAGVACLKLEGRMKRPEYVSIVTGVYSRALREGRDPSPEEYRQLEAAFSRQGFTDGYFIGNKGAHMFGVREEQDDPRELFKAARSVYENGDNPLVPIHFSAKITADSPAEVTASDNDGNCARVVGSVPEAARTREVSASEIEQRLSKTGGTPFYCESANAEVQGGLSMPASAVNALRRDALEELTRLRGEPKLRKTDNFVPPIICSGYSDVPEITVSLRRAEQFSAALCEGKPKIIYMPVGEIHAHREVISACRNAGIELCATLPRICWDREQPELLGQLAALKDEGITEVLVGTHDLIRPARDLGFALRGDFGLGVFNSMTAQALADEGFCSMTASFELRLEQIRALSKPIDTEIISYGRLPLMITENCIIKNRSGKCGCQNENELTDRRGEHFPVLNAPGCRNEIFNAKTLYLADKADELKSLGLWGLRLSFTTESAEDCAQILREYRRGGTFDEKNYTRGLYFRGVE